MDKLKTLYEVSVNRNAGYCFYFHFLSLLSKIRGIESKTPGPGGFGPGALPNPPDFATEKNRRLCHIKRADR